MKKTVALPAVAESEHSSSDFAAKLESQLRQFNGQFGTRFVVSDFKVLRIEPVEKPLLQH